MDGFVDKSRDALPGELSQLVASSSLTALATLFKPAEADGGGSGGAPGGLARGGGARARSGGGARRVVTLSGLFQDSFSRVLRRR